MTRCRSKPPTRSDRRQASDGATRNRGIRLLTGETNTVTRYNVTDTAISEGEVARSSAERMRAMRQRRRAEGRRDIRISAPDARSDAVRARVAHSVTGLDPANETDALDWIEAVSQFDEHEEG